MNVCSSDGIIKGFLKVYAFKARQSVASICVHCTGIVRNLCQEMTGALLTCVSFEIKLFLIDTCH
jgi:hypothetical protein